MSLPVLEAALEKQLGLERATRIEECFQGAPGHFLSRPPLLVAGHFDPAVDVLVVERELATLGLVYALEGPPQVLAGQVERAVERAAYMRHLLVAQPASRGDLSQPQRRRPWAVELVLASLGNAACEAEVHKALRRVAAESQLLFAVGVGLLHRDEESDVPTGAALRRAFPWLLRESRAWYQKLAPPSSSRAREQPLRTLEVENFRLPGSRRLELAEGADLHVVHGANGTGKSSLVEALELAMTGKIERLAVVAEDYRKVLAHREKKPTSVSLSRGGSRPRTWTVSPTGSEGKPLADPRLVATSFRLDQPVMDRLTLPANREQRAVTFFEAFFPDDAAQLQSYYGAQASRDRALEQLPSEVREPLLAGDVPSDEAIRARLAWLQPETAGQPVDLAQASWALPVPLAELEGLAILAPELSTLTLSFKAPGLSGAGARQLIEKIEAVLRRMVVEELPHLEPAASALEKLADWAVDEGEAAAGSPFLATLDAWLEARALADLADKELQLLSTLRLASERGWRSAGPFKRVSGPRIGQLSAFKTLQAERVSRLTRELAAAEASPQRSSRRPRGAAHARPYLSAEQLAALNQVGPWLGAPELGSAVERALQTQQTVPAQSVEVGRPGWTEPLRRTLEELQQRLTRLGGATRLRERLGEARPIQLLSNLAEAQEALAKLGQSQHQAWLAKLQGDSSLSSALNELLALFTPARWAYEDIQLVHSLDPQSRHRLSVRTAGDQEVDLRYNSAQLNLFVVALFLLCAPGRPNPLSLLVLDDPLQNMDELTVTTLARGISRLWRGCLAPRGWQALLLFHGEEDLERFRRELPAAVYQLPFQSPAERSAQGAEEAITADSLASRHLAADLDLSSVLIEVPPGGSS